MSWHEDDLKSQSVTAVRDRTQEISSALSHPEENRVKKWFLLTGGRLVVSAALLFAVFVVLLGVSVIQPLEMRNLLTETTAVTTLFSALLSGAILLVSIVVSISSIVLSHEMTDIETQQERIAASIEYRKRIEEFIDADITPARPAEFLRVVLHAIFEHAQALEEIASDSSNDEFQTHTKAFMDNVTDEINQAQTTLGETRFGTFTVLLAGLNYDYSGQLHAARGFKLRYAETLTDEEREVIEDLVETLTFFATGREYFKSLYYKQEFARLSSRLLYVSLPVIVFTSYIILALDANFFPDVTLFGLSPLLVFVSFAYVIALAPYVVLTAYVIRAAAITLRTLTAGPFILQQGNEIDGLDWEMAENQGEWDLTERSTDE